MKLTALLITKNESAMLARCLDSLKGVDDYIIVDTGSTDKTVEIAEKYTKNVFTDYAWADDFASARNYALSKVTEGFCLVIDADEINLTPIPLIREAIAQLGDFNALSVKMQWDDNHSHQVPRIFHHSLRYIGKIHEYIVANAKPSDIVFKYEKSPAHDLDPDRNLRILLQDTANPRSQFYLANEYFDRGDRELALKWYLAYLKVGTWRYEIADANLQVAKCLWGMRRGDEARNYCLQAILGNPNFSEALRFMGEMSWEKERVSWLKYGKMATDENVIFIRGEK